MKRITTTVEDKNGQAKRVSVFVDEDTEKVISGVDEHWQREYILEEHKATNRTRAETRRHISYEGLMELSGNELPSFEENPLDRLLKNDSYSFLHVVCTIGQEDKKLLLFDDFSCFDEGVYIGEVSLDVIENLRKSN